MTAVATVILLHRQLACRQWFAVFMLMVGVSLVLMKGDARREDNAFVQHGQRPLVGATAVLFCCTCSAFCGVWFERIIKPREANCGNPPSVWVASHLLATCSIPCSLAVVLIWDYRHVAHGRAFRGFDLTVVGVVCLLVLSGLIVGLTIKVADAVVKTFAVATAIPLTLLGSFFIFGSSLGPQFLLGAALVLAANAFYSLSPPARTAGMSVRPTLENEGLLKEAVANKQLLSPTGAVNKQLPSPTGADGAQSPHRSSQPGALVPSFRHGRGRPGYLARCWKTWLGAPCSPGASNGCAERRASTAASS
jgi:UDP-galactose transporter